MMPIRQRMATSRSHAVVVALALAAGALAPARVVAQQGISSIITGPKQAALRAAAKANAQTAAMQDVGSTPTQPGGAAPQAARRPPAPIRAAAPAPAAHASSVASQPHAAPNGSAKPAATVANASKAAAATAAKAAPTALIAKAAPAVHAAPAANAGPAAGGDSAGSISVTERGVKGEVSLNREVFSYDAGDRRDPFISLMRSGDLRPMLSDLRLTTVLYDATGQNSIAVMRDQSTKDQYRVRVGMTLGRMRVTQIQPKQVVFTIEEVGFSRQEALALGDTTKARTP